MATAASPCTRGTPAPPSSSPSGPWPSASTSSTWTASRARSAPNRGEKKKEAQEGMKLHSSTNQPCTFFSFFFNFPLQSKIHAARSLSEIAIDLTETGTLKTSKLANMGSKGKIISGSSGSLLSSGQCTVIVLEREGVRAKRWRTCVYLFSCRGGEISTLEGRKQLHLQGGAGFCANVVTHATHSHATPPCPPLYV